MTFEATCPDNLKGLAIQNKVDENNSQSGMKGQTFGEVAPFTTRRKSLAAHKRKCRQ
jgi:hypothetical protein